MTDKGFKGIKTENSAEPIDPFDARFTDSKYSNVRSTITITVKQPYILYQGPILSEKTLELNPYVDEVIFCDDELEKAVKRKYVRPFWMSEEQFKSLAYWVEEKA